MGTKRNYSSNIWAKKSPPAPLQAAPWRWGTPSSRCHHLWFEDSLHLEPLPGSPTGSLSTFHDTEISRCMMLFFFPWTAAPAQGEKKKTCSKATHHSVVRIYSSRFNVLAFSTLYLNGCCPGFPKINHPCASLHFGHGSAGIVIYVFPGQVFSPVQTTAQRCGCPFARSLWLCLTGRHLPAGKEPHMSLKFRAAYKLLCSPKLALKIESKSWNLWLLKRSHFTYSAIKSGWGGGGGDVCVLQCPITL